MQQKLTFKKVKSAIQSRIIEGTYTGSKAPFGYLKDPNNKHRLIIDEKTKPIIELIDFVHFSCSTYKKYGVNACSSHKIEARDRYNIVLEDI